MKELREEFDVPLRFPQSVREGLGYLNTETELVSEV